MSADTIFALSSAHGKAGVSVVRVSGDGAFLSLRALCDLTDDITPRYALFKPLINPSDKTIIDHALVIPFLGPSSFTGEDVVEYHVHGSPAVLSLLFSVLSKFENHRMAEHGEFTRRAFENGKMDLVEAESIADLINATTQMQREQALLQMDGALSRLYEGWRDRLIRIMAYIEVVIDFPDEDIPDDQIKTKSPDLEILRDEILKHLNDGSRGERLRDGITITILGAPNAGKSSLLNLLSKRDVAIVSPMAGTTRDVIEVHLDVAGYPVILADTAGLRLNHLNYDGGHGAVEHEGIKRAMNRAKNSDIRILVFDGTLDDFDDDTLNYISPNSIVVLTKTDDKNFKPLSSRQNYFTNDVAVVAMSTITGDGVDELIAALSQKISDVFALSRDTPSLTRARHRDALEQTVSCINNALTAPLPELVAEDVRMAARNLGRITGRVDVEDLLDVIFKDFCIGK